MAYKTKVILTYDKVKILSISPSHYFSSKGRGWDHTILNANKQQFPKKV